MVKYTKSDLIIEDTEAIKFAKKYNTHIARNGSEYKLVSSAIDEKALSITSALTGKQKEYIKSFLDNEKYNHPEIGVTNTSEGLRMKDFETIGQEFSAPINTFLIFVTMTVVLVVMGVVINGELDPYGKHHLTDTGHAIAERLHAYAVNKQTEIDKTRQEEEYERAHSPFKL